MALATRRGIGPPRSLAQMRKRSGFFWNKRSASNVQEGGEHSEAIGSQPSSSSDLHPKIWAFVQDMTPNVKDKVYWIPSKQSWKVKAQKREVGRAFTEMFLVDDGLKGEDFKAMKARKYLEALREWNAGDRSKRHRIEIPCFLLDYTNQTAPLSQMTVIADEGSASGSQPSSSYQRIFGEMM